MSTSSTVAGKPLPQEHFDAASGALSGLTERSAPHDDPKEHIHAPADAEKSHSWFRSLFPYDSLADFESQWHLGNYVIDRESGEKQFEAMSVYVRVGMHLLYYGSEQEKMLHWQRTQDLLREQSVRMGKQYDDPASKDHIKPFIDSFNLQSSLQELLEPDPSKYPTFNAFFARKLKPSARPIAEATNEKAISSPADCRLTTFPTVSQATKYWIKGYGFTLAKLLGSDELATRFDGGSVAIARLAPQDYHRWHSPVDGTVVGVTEIPGAYYTVNPQAINEPGTLDVFCENRRSVMLLSRKTTSAPVAVVAVGAMLVGSLRYEPELCDAAAAAAGRETHEGPGKVRVGAEVRRGQCLGAFYYGGSTVIVVSPKNEVAFDEDLVRNSTEKGCETLVRVGWRIGAGP